MNLVIDDAVEVKQATKTEGESRRQLGTWRIPWHTPSLPETTHVAAHTNMRAGQILLKGDNVSLIQSLQ